MITSLGVAGLIIACALICLLARAVVPLCLFHIPLTILERTRRLPLRVGSTILTLVTLVTLYSLVDYLSANRHIFAVAWASDRAR